MDPECARPDSPVTTRPAPFSRSCRSLFPSLASLYRLLFRLATSSGAQLGRPLWRGRAADVGASAQTQLQEHGRRAGLRVGLSELVKGSPPASQPRESERAKRRWRSADAPSGAGSRLLISTRPAFLQHPSLTFLIPRFCCSSIVGRPRHQGVMVGMGQKDSYVG